MDFAKRFGMRDSVREYQVKLKRECLRERLFSRGENLQGGSVLLSSVGREAVDKAIKAYTEKHLGPKEEIGNKGGSLSNRLRAVMA